LLISDQKLIHIRLFTTIVNLAERFYCIKTVITVKAPVLLRVVQGLITAERSDRGRGTARHPVWQVSKFRGHKLPIQHCRSSLMFFSRACRTISRTVRDFY